MARKLTEEQKARREARDSSRFTDWGVDTLEIERAPEPEPTPTTKTD